MTEPHDTPLNSGLLAAIAANRKGRIALQLLRWSIPVILLVLLGRRLGELGWRQIWIARPDSIAFYVFLVLQFFLQPFGDYLISGVPLVQYNLNTVL